jgi:hypothetical protein
MVITLQQSVQVPQRLPSMTVGVISIHSPRETIAPVFAWRCGSDGKPHCAAADLMALY